MPLASREYTKPDSNPPSLSQWQEKGTYHQVDGKQVFVVESGAGPETLVILHGYPTCSYDYWKVLPTLSQHFRVILHDHIGFGLSDKPIDYSYSLIEQTDIALQLWGKMGVKKAHVLAHDYGTSVATELIARTNRGWNPIEFRTMSLCNGSMHIEMAQLRLIQKLLLNKKIGPLIAQMSRYSLFSRNMRNIWGDASKVDEAELATLWEMLLHNSGRAVLSRTTQYIRERKLFWHRWIGALQSTQTPINILWATEDPVAVRAMAHTLHAEIPNSQLQLLEGLGHYPMIEDPKTWVLALLTLLSSPHA